MNVNASHITLREATLDDGEILLLWRNDQSTRSVSHNSDVIDMGAHKAWLSSLLADSQKFLFIAEVEGEPVGNVRAELVEGDYLLSWTVSSKARGKGVAKVMVKNLCDQLSLPVRAEIKKDNVASIRVAMNAGLVCEKEDGGVLYFYSHKL